MAAPGTPGVDANDDYSKLKVIELKKLLKDKGLSVTGTKDELIERLKAAAEAAEKKLLEETETAENIDEELENEIMKEDSKVTTSVGPKKVAEKRKAAADKTLQTPAKKGENKENTEGKDGEDKGEEDAETPVAKKIIKLSTITPEEKKELRAKKFGLTEDEKKAARAKRFGIPVVAETTSPLTTKGKNTPKKADGAGNVALKKRAERFGILGDRTLTPEEVEKRKKRAERFGMATPTPVTPATPVEVKK